MLQRVDPAHIAKKGIQKWGQYWRGNAGFSFFHVHELSPANAHFKQILRYQRNIEKLADTGNIVRKYFLAIAAI